ncbi:Ig-like domain-containing protein [Luteimicrobium subarcticum]|uniref:Fibronectin type III domain protein n=1 Tax=Luteimicrobium subarcticum TaxID=620910 RepID=A0A2M8WVN9_9MICO|nr:Ig-like domain-containing protein [Luteimicrobium subarcticum]PJI94990.1 fibronectin type III domain protein [Luteimicrobium subarcticum]
MGILQRLGARRKTVTSVGTVSVVSTAMIALALTYDGQPTADVHLNDSGVWVTKGSSAMFGRFNESAQAIDATLVGGSTAVDVLQQGTSVLAFDPSLGSLSRVDVANAKLQGTAKLPADAQVGMGGAATAILDAAGQHLWVVPTDGVAAFDKEVTPATAEVGKRSVLTVGLDGTVRVVDPAGTVTTVRTTGKGGVDGVSTAHLDGTAASDVVSATTVGGDLVVLDTTTGKVRLPDGTWVAVDGAQPVLQQAGPGSSSVALATTTALVSQPLDGSASVVKDGSGRPSAPVQVGGCTYGAWAGTGQVVRDCAGTDRDLVKTLDGVDPSAALSYRFNRDVVVLNELSAGTVWMAADQFQKVDDWELKLPENAKGEKTEAENDKPEQVDKPISAQRKKNHDPIAKNDTFGVRPGRSTVLPVLGNDVDPDGDVMVAALDGDQPSNAHVDQAMGGDALLATADPDASGTSTFQYKVTDGRGGNDTASVRLEVVPLDKERNPEQTGEPVLQLEKGTTGRIKVLPYFRDPDGDDLYLADAQPKVKGDEVRFEPDGTVEYRDTGATTGRKAVTLVVADGLGGTVEGTLWVDVKAPGNLPPVAVGDHAQTRVGEPVTVEPLKNDSDPNGDELRLASVANVPGAKITTSSDGTFQFVAQAADSYVFTYQVTDGPSTATGVARVDVVDPAKNDGAPVTVPDTALLPSGGQTLVGVLDNDTDPSGGVLVVQSVRVPDDAGITVAVLAHSVLRITEVKHFDQPITIHYTASNGTQSSTGQVRVISVPPPNRLHPPNAVADEATVHVGDVVTIPVLANDTHPDGFALTLDPKLSQEPDPKLGKAFVSDTVVRFQAGTTPGTAYAIYKVRDKNDQVDSAQITVHILGGDQNSPPKPPTLDARTLSGGSVTITVPLDGTDPDGDSVRLTGIGTPPSKGQAKVTNGTIVYTAGKRSTGTDAFTYTVADARGQTASGSVRVGVASPPAQNQPPVAVDDTVQARPDRDLSVAVMKNDSDPDGDVIALVRQAVEGHGVTAKVAQDRIAFRTPSKPGTYSIVYTIQDTAGARASAVLVVQVAKDAPLKPPVARDDVLSGDDIIGRTSVSVDVRANDEDPDGAATALTVSTKDTRATVVAGKVVVPLTEDPQTILYTVTDPDGLTASAFVRVPGLQAEAPTLRTDVSPPTVRSNEPLTIDIRKYVRVADGKTPVLTEESKVSAVNGSRVVKDKHTIVFTSDEDFAGDASVAFEVTDGTGADDPKGHKATLSLRIDVTAPKNEPPVWKQSPTVQVPSGGEVGAKPVRVDLAQSASDAEDDPLTFTAGQGSQGLKVSLDGSVVTVSAPPELAKGATIVVPVTVKDEKNAAVGSNLTVKIVASDREKPRAVEDDVAKAHQGEELRIPVLDNDFNPFADEGKPLTVTAVTLATGGAAQPTVQGDDVVVTPDADFVGTLRLRYTVQDATKDPDRDAEGQIEVTVQGRPDAPATPETVEVRSHTVVLSWSPPNDNGDPIEYYTVQSADGSVSQRCETTTCTIEGLTNNQKYTFTVTATNEVNTSDPSPESEEARPDEKPDAPDAPTLEFGDGELTVTWDNKTYDDRSPIENVNLQISPAPDGQGDEQTGVTGTKFVWKGLANGTGYTVRVQAVNQAPEPSDWGAVSAAETPAGKPAAPAKPTVTRTSLGQQAQMKVEWVPPSDNGGTISGYDIRVLRGGSEQKVVTAEAAATSQVIDVDANTTDYTFEVRAKNKATEKFGDAAWSPASNAVRAFAKPGSPGTVTATATGANTTVRLAWGTASATGLKDSEIMYQYSACGGGWTSTSNGAKAATVTCGSNGTRYTYQVRAVPNFEGSLDTTNAGPSSSDTATPYGPPRTPGVSASGNAKSVTLSWTDPGSNGHPYQLQISVDGGGWQNKSGGGSTTVGNGYSEKHSIKARTIETGDSSRTAESDPASATSGKEPEIHVTVSSGPQKDVTGCVGSACHQFNVTASDNFPSGSHDIECFWTYGGADHSVTGHSYNVTLNAGATITMSCVAGHHSGAIAWVTVDGTSYKKDAITWPN